MVNSYKLVILNSAEKDKEKISSIPALKTTSDKLLEILKTNPYQNPPPYEKLVGNFKGLYARRINRQHRLVYRVIEDEKTVIIVSMWSHYEF
ncbi:MAG: Txe/YoeB family addiction module toxin [Syntrophomonadaceae bacterium]|nr:Txe/YoeB family addiction module toxin [Syntrophomonadaceae bacterium]